MRKENNSGNCFQHFDPSIMCEEVTTQAKRSGVVPSSAPKQISLHESAGIFVLDIKSKGLEPRDGKMQFYAISQKVTVISQKND